MEALLLFLGGIAAVALIILYSSFTWGFVLYKFYYWFLLPVFTTLPQITFWQAVGVMIFIGLFKDHSTKKQTLGGTELKTEPQWASIIVAPWLVLSLAWIVKLFL